MSQSILQQRLIKIKPFRCKLWRVMVFFKQFIDDMSWFVLLLDEAKDLIYFVRDDVSILVLLIFLRSFLLSVEGVIFLVILGEFDWLRFYLLFYWLPFVLGSALKTHIRLLLHPFSGLTIEGKDYWWGYQRSSWLWMTGGIYLELRT